MSGWWTTVEETDPEPDPEGATTSDARYLKDSGILDALHVALSGALSGASGDKDHLNEDNANKLYEVTATIVEKFGDTWAVEDKLTPFGPTFYPEHFIKPRKPQKPTYPKKERVPPSEPWTKSMAAPASQPLMLPKLKTVSARGVERPASTGPIRQSNAPQYFVEPLELTAQTSRTSKAAGASSQLIPTKPKGRNINLRRSQFDALIVQYPGLLVGASLEEFRRLAEAEIEGRVLEQITDSIDREMFRLLYVEADAEEEQSLASIQPEADSDGKGGSERSVAESDDEVEFMAKEFDPVLKEIREIAGDAAQSDALLLRFGVEGDGGASLAEIEKTVLDKWPLLNQKHALMRAYKRTTGKAGKGDGSDRVERKALTTMLENLVLYNKHFKTSTTSTRATTAARSDARTPATLVSAQSES